MTEKTQPTDAEIDELWRFEASKNWDSTLAMRTSFARAVLAKWGQPAVAAEPVAWMSPGKERLEFSRQDTVYGSHTIPLYTTPQPTQPQAGAVPLTCEWTHNEDDGFWETACGEAWRFDDGGPGENNMHFCHSCGNSLRIKGGQHGTE